MTNEEFIKLKKIALKEICFDEDRILEQSAGIAKLYQKYLSIYVTELENYNRLSVKVDEIFGQLMRHYTMDDDIAWKNQSALVSQVKSDAKYVKAVIARDTSEVQMKFIEKTLANIKDMSHNVRNYLEAKKLLTGRDY